MNYLQRCVRPSSNGSRFFVKCIILAHVMSASIGTSVSSNVAPAVVRAVNVNSRGQVLGLWWTDKKILNDAPPGLAPFTSAEVEAAKEEVNKINLVSKIRYSMLALKGDFMDVSGSTVRYDLIKGSPKFQEYLTLVRQLEYVNLKDLNELERRAFLINIYNSLVIHALVEGLLKKSPGGSLSRIQLYASASYNIGGEIYSLNEIENGLLRGNRLSAVPFTRVPFPESDSRRQSMLECDPRIHFALNCGAVSCPPIAVYSADRLDEQLSDAAAGFLEGNTEVNTKDNTVNVSMLFKWYREDFGGSDSSIISWIKTHSPTKLSEVIALLVNPALSYPTYNWNLNQQEL